MDFMCGLPMSRNQKDVCIIVDRLTKIAHFIPINMHYSMETLAQLYIQEVIPLLGVLSSIVSDRDLWFTSRFWRKFQESLGSNLNFNTFAHPHIDGQSKRVI